MRTYLVLALVAVIAFAWAGMQRAWRGRLNAQADIATPHPATRAEVLAGPWSCSYLGATHAGRWLDRIDAHTLGERAAAEVRVTTQGIDILRDDATSFAIPHSDLLSVRADKAIAGRAYEDGGIVVISFNLGDLPIDIGVRFPSTADHLAALAALASREVAS